VNKIRHGLKCTKCHQFNVEAIGGHIIFCTDCGDINGLEDMIIKYFEAVDVIMPGGIYKRGLIKDHLRVNISEYTLQKIMKTNFTRLGGKKRSYYFSP